MDCAKCEHKAEIDALNAWLETHKGNCPISDERRAFLIGRCLKCNPDSEDHHGVSHVSLEVMGGAAGGSFKIEGEYLAGRRAGKENLTPLTEEAEEAVWRLLHEIAQLDIADVEILHGLLNGMNCTQIATAFGYANRAVVHQRLKRAIQNPWIEAMYTRGHTYGAKMGRQSKTWERWKEGRTFKRGNNGKPLAHLPSVSPDDLAARPREGLKTSAR